MPEIQLGVHTIRSHGARVARIHMHDWLILLLLVVIDAVLNIIEPFHRFVGEGMLTDLRYPLKDNTIPFWAVPVCFCFTSNSRTLLDVWDYVMLALDLINTQDYKLLNFNFWTGNSSIAATCHLSCLLFHSKRCLWLSPCHIGCISEPSKVFPPILLISSLIYHNVTITKCIRPSIFCTHYCGDNWCYQRWCWTATAGFLLALFP